MTKALANKRSALKAFKGQFSGQLDWQLREQLDEQLNQEALWTI